MKNFFSHFILLVQKIDRQHIQLVAILVALALMVLGVGAPEDAVSPLGR